MNARPLWQRLLLAAVIAVVAVVLTVTIPSVVNSYELYLVTQVLVFAVCGLGLTVLIGWSGQIALAQAGFFGVGAYGTSYLAQEGLPWPVAVVAAGIIAALFGLVIGLPSVRLKGFYLAIATLAFGALLQRVFISAADITGGANGFSVEPLMFLGLTHDASLWYTCVLTAAAAVAVLWWVGRSRPGRAFRAVRDAEIATRSLGISATRYKLLAFAISAFLGSVGGSLYSQLTTFLTPESFTTTLMIQFLVVVFIGGVVDLTGAFVGAVFLVLSVELLQDLGSWQRLAYGLALVLIVRLLPRGLTSLPKKLVQYVRSRRTGQEPPPPAAAATPDTTVRDAVGSGSTT